MKMKLSHFVVKQLSNFENKTCGSANIRNNSASELNMMLSHKDSIMEPLPVDISSLHNCVIQKREDPVKLKDKVVIGCGAGFGGDRPIAALKLMQRVKNLNYIVLECLAERTLADRYQDMINGGYGFDPRISEWMHMLLPLALDRGICIISNMGAMDPLGAQNDVLEVARVLGVTVKVAIAYEIADARSGNSAHSVPGIGQGSSTYLGAAPIVECLEKHKPNVILTSRVADAALFLGPLVFELGWNWDEFDLLAQGSLAGHLLECGCQLTGGYFMHSGDKHRNLPLDQLLDLSLPYAEVTFEGKVFVSKAHGSGGLLNLSTCAEQLLYEVGDPGAYITPDVVVDFRDVSFQQLSENQVLCSGAKSSELKVPEKLLRLVPEDHGWKGWGEISYGGHGCVDHAKAADFLVRSWMEEVIPGVTHCILSYIIGLDSLKPASVGCCKSTTQKCDDIRLRVDGLFAQKEHAIQLTKEITALYTNGPAAGGGISTGHKRQITLIKELVSREDIFWCTGVKTLNLMTSEVGRIGFLEDPVNAHCLNVQNLTSVADADANITGSTVESPVTLSPAPLGQKVALYEVAHSRTGDKGNDVNFSIIPHYAPDIEKLKIIITPDWVKSVVSSLLGTSSSLNPIASNEKGEGLTEDIKVEIYEVPGIHSLNVVVRDILDGGVNCSRRIDRHGKTISGLILSQEIMFSS